jgi:hypothetical protein
MKTDIFKREMYYVYEGQYAEAPIALSVDAVKEIIHRNKQGLDVGDVEEFIVQEVVVEKETDFAQVVGQDSLTRFDKSKRKGQNQRGRGNNDRRRDARPSDASKNPNDQRPPRRDNDNRNRTPREGNRENQNPRPPRTDQQNRPQTNGDNKERPKNNPNNKPRGQRRDRPPRGPKPDAPNPSPNS